MSDKLKTPYEEPFDELTHGFLTHINDEDYDIIKTFAPNGWNRTALQLFLHAVATDVNQAIEESGNFLDGKQAIIESVRRRTNIEPVEQTNR